jgi:hypothetical protein
MCYKIVFLYNHLGYVIIWAYTMHMLYIICTCTVPFKWAVVLFSAIHDLLLQQYSIHVIICACMTYMVTFAPTVLYHYLLDVIIWAYMVYMLLFAPTWPLSFSIFGFLYCNFCKIKQSMQSIHYTLLYFSDVLYINWKIILWSCREITSIYYN